MPAVCGVSLVAVMGGAETQHRRAAERRSRVGVSHGAWTTPGRDRRAPLTSHREAGPCRRVTRGRGPALTCHTRGGFALTSHGAACTLLCEKRRAMHGVLPACVPPGRPQAEPGGWRGPLALCGVAEQLLSELVAVPPLALSTRCSPASPSPCGFRPSAGSLLTGIPFTQPRSGLGGTEGQCD